LRNVLDRAINGVAGVVRRIVRLRFHVGRGTIANARNRVVVVDLIDGGNACARSGCACHGTYNSANRTACECAYDRATNAACNRTFFCIVVRIVVNTVLNVIVCHDCSRLLGGMNKALAERMPITHAISA
jgi:hypothetical protein